MNYDTWNFELKIHFKYSWTHPNRVFYVKLILMRSWNSDVSRYVTVTKLLNSLFNILLIFLRRWEIQTYWVNNSVESTFRLTAKLLPEFPRSFIRTAAGSFMLLPQWQRKTKKLSILWVNNIVNISSCISAHMWWVIGVINWRRIRRAWHMACMGERRGVTWRKETNWKT